MFMHSDAKYVWCQGAVHYLRHKMRGMRQKVQKVTKGGGGSRPPLESMASIMNRPTISIQQ